MDLKKLDDKFSSFDIEWRIGRCGFSKDGRPWAVALAYITNRAIQSRLDDVCGKECWKNEFKEWHGDSQICGISIKSKDEWITKWDGADKTGFEGTKGGLSDSMKRAGYQWGIGRYLYDLPETWTDCSTQKNNDWKYHYSKKEDKSFYWKTPQLPVWALPESEKTKNNNSNQDPNNDFSVPTSPNTPPKDSKYTETCKKLKDVITDKYWEDAKIVFKENYPDLKKISDIVLKHGDDILKEINKKGLKLYLSGLPF